MGKRKYGVTMPRTLERSPAKAQRTYAKALTNAEREYGSGERAGRTAYGALKHSFEKVDDRWQPKARRGPSDAQSARSGAAARAGQGRSFGGVDALGHTREELYARAKALGIKGRSSMTKEELAGAIAKKQR